MSGPEAWVKVQYSKFLGNESPAGGGALLLGLNTSGTVVGSQFEDNNSTQGGAILVQEYAKLKLNGGLCTSNS